MKISIAALPATDGSRMIVCVLFASTAASGLWSSVFVPNIIVGHV